MAEVERLFGLWIVLRSGKEVVKYGRLDSLKKLASRIEQGMLAQAPGVTHIVEDGETVFSVWLPDVSAVIVGLVTEQYEVQARLNLSSVHKLGEGWVA